VPKNQTRILSDFPSVHRLGDAMLFRELLGNPGRSTFARWLKIGLIPPPDVKLGALNRWRETRMASVVEALAVESLPKAKNNAADGKGEAHAAL
jgi:hypothetical protein